MLTEKQEKYWGYAGLMILLIITSIIRLNFLDFPFERDEGLYAHFASLILDGKLPYEAFYDPKPPGLFYSYAWIMTIFGQTPQGLHIGFLLVNLLTIFLIYLSAKNLWGSMAGLASASSFAFLSLVPHAGGLSVLSEHLLVFWVALGIYLIIKATDNRSFVLFMFSGLIFGYSLFIKQNGIFFIAAGTLYVLYHYRWIETQNWGSTLKNTFFFGVMSLVPTLLLALYLTTRGFANEYYYWAVKYPIYLQNVSFQEGKKYLMAILLHLAEGYWLWWVLGLIGLLSTFFLSHRKTKFLLLSIGFFSLLSITPRLTFHGHYFLFLIPAFALCSGVLIYKIEQYLTHRLGDLLASICLITGLGIGITFQLISQRDNYFSPDHVALIKDIYSTNPFVESKVVSEKIKILAQPNDQMVVYGGEMQIYFYTGLDAPTKHLYGPYLVDGTPEQNQRQMEFMQDLEQTKPRFFVAVNHPLTWVIKGRAKDQKIFHWYSDFVKNYELIGLVAMNSGQPTKCYWDNTLNSKSLQGDFNIFVWQLRNPNR